MEPSRPDKLDRGPKVCARRLTSAVLAVKRNKLDFRPAFVHLAARSDPVDLRLRLVLRGSMAPAVSRGVGAWFAVKRRFWCNIADFGAQALRAGSKAGGLLPLARALIDGSSRHLLAGIERE